MYVALLSLPRVGAHTLAPDRVGGPAIQIAPIEYKSRERGTTSWALPPSSTPPPLPPFTRHVRPLIHRRPTPPDPPTAPRPQSGGCEANEQISY
eukprot:2799557-Prymnesium_polylepis.2